MTYRVPVPWQLMVVVVVGVVVVVVVVVVVRAQLLLWVVVVVAVVVVELQMVMTKWQVVLVVVLHQKTRRTRKTMKMKKMSRLLEASFHRLAQTLMIASPSMVVESVKNLPLMSVPPVEDRLFACTMCSSFWRSRNGPQVDISGACHILLIEQT